MVNIFEGLEKFGVGADVEDLYVDKAAEAAEAAKKAALEASPEAKEEDILLERTYPCACCGEEFKAKSVKNGKAKSLGTDIDLRAKYDGIDMVKYDVIACPHCGYATLTRYFKLITGPQRKAIKEKITPGFKGLPQSGAIYTYDEAMERYQLALANAVVKGAKPSEKAYVCLKSGWLVRGIAENLDPALPDYKEQIAKYEVLEQEYLKNAMEGFVVARQKESYPMCGMDEYTVDYLIAALAIKIKSYDVAARLISAILTNATAPPRIKDKARDLKEIIVEMKK